MINFGLARKGTGTRLYQNFDEILNSRVVGVGLKVEQYLQRKHALKITKETDSTNILATSLIKAIHSYMCTVCG